MNMVMIMEASHGPMFHDHENWDHEQKSALRDEKRVIQRPLIIFFKKTLLGFDPPHSDSD